MPLPDAPEHDPAIQDAEKDPLAHFRNWPGFFFASIALNVLFVYGMLAGVSDPSVAIWYKVLAWFPFNVIATAIYLAIMARLATSPAALAYRILGSAMIVANWSVMFAV